MEANEIDIPGTWKVYGGKGIEWAVVGQGYPNQTEATEAAVDWMKANPGNQATAMLSGAVKYINITSV